MKPIPGKYVNTRGSYFTGFVLKMVSKKIIGNVEMHEEGFTCSCNTKTRCNHIRGVEQLLSNGESFLAYQLK